MIVGTAGHIDHGKTSLVKALTGTDTDRLKEEKARGITIELGFAYWPRPDGSVIGFVDVPGHERFVHTMLAGAHGIDLVLLVVAADDGVMPQTREHLEILDLLGLGRGLVVLSKADLVDADTLLAREIEIGEALAGTALEGADVIPVSTLTGSGIAQLVERLDAEAARLAPRNAARAFRLAVDRSFALAGAGTVVTGTVLDGAVAVGDTVTLSPSGLSARIRSIHAQNHPAAEARAGDRAALNLAGPSISKDAVRRGDMVLAPALHLPTARIDAELRVLASEKKALAQWMPVRLHHATAEVGARLVHLGDGGPAPGETRDVQLVLEHPIAATALDRFILRDVSQSRTIGGGRFLDLRAPERRRRSAERGAIRDGWRAAEAGDALAGLLSLPPHVLPLAGFLADRGLPADGFAADGERETFVADGRDYVAARSWLAGFETRLLEELEGFHRDNPDLAGIGLERLRRLLAPRLAAGVFRALLRRTQGSGGIVIDGAWVRLATHTIVMTPEDENLWAEIAVLLGGDERFRPPRVRDIGRHLGIEEDKVRGLCRRMQRMAAIDEVAHDHFFLRATVGEMTMIIRALSNQKPDGWFSAAEYRDRLENGRKVAIQILEFFDRHGVTFRRGDLRRPNPHRQDLFLSEGAAGSGGEASPVGRPDFKSGWGREPVLGGFDSHSPPPSSAAGVRP